MTRFFVPGSHRPGDVVSLDGGDARKVRTVLRMRSGDRIELIDSAGVAYAAELEFDERTVRARLGGVLERASEMRLKVTLAQGVPKGSKMDLVVEKATELGAVGVLPFFSERSAGEHVGASKLERWRRIARSASEQSGRQRIAEVEDPLSYDGLIDRFPHFERTLVAWELAPRMPLAEQLPALLEGVTNVLVAVGPEGGLSHGEVSRAAAAGAEVISLGARILRTETAGLVALAAVAFATREL